MPKAYKVFGNMVLHYFTSIIAKQLIAKSMFSRIFRDKISAVPINCKQLIAKLMFSRIFKSKISKIKRNQKKSKEN